MAGRIQIVPYIAQSADLTTTTTSDVLPAAEVSLFDTPSRATSVQASWATLNHRRHTIQAVGKWPRKVRRSIYINASGEHLSLSPVYR